MNRPQRVAHVVALVVIGACSSARAVLAQGCPELVGRLPYGSTEEVAVSGDFAYFNAGDSLRIANISDPMSPQLLGHIALPGTVNAIAVSGSYAYVTRCHEGLRVIDVSTPSTPVEVGFLAMPCAVDVAVLGGYAYVADTVGVFRVIDVSTPSAPIEVGHIDNPAGSANGLEVSGGHAYVTGGHSWVAAGAGLQVIDISIPSAPTAVGWVDTPDFPDDVAVAGDYAYVTFGVDYGGMPSLSVIDVSTPSAPVEVGSVEMQGYCDAGDVDVAALGSYAYVAAGRLCGLRVIDVSIPSGPVEVGFLDTPDAYDVVLSGDYAYVAAEWEGLAVIDVSTPSAPIAVGWVYTPRSIFDVAVEGGYAYAADRGAVLRVINVSTPSAPLEVGFLDTSGGASNTSSVALSGGYAYLTWVDDFDQGLRVIDVSTPSAPVEVGFAHMPRYSFPVSVAVSGAYAFVAASSGSGEGGLWVIDVRSPSSPVDVAFLSTPDFQTDVAVVGGHAFVASTGEYGEAGLSVIDVSTPSAPVEVGWIDTPAPAQGVSVEGDHAYVTWGHDYGEAGLSVIDVSTPSTPVEVGFVTIPHLAGRLGVAASRGFAYVSSGSGGLRVIDVSIPSAPLEAGHDAHYGEGVAVSGGYVFLAGEGVTIYNECSDPAADPRECFIPAAAVAAGAQGAFFQTDLEVNNKGAVEAQVTVQWLPRGQNNSEPMESEPIALAPGQSLHYENVLNALFGLEPDSVGALRLVASTDSVIGMSRTYNVPGAKIAGTFGQGLPAVRATEMISGTDRRRIIFLSEEPDSRANVGCVNGTGEQLRVNVAIFDAQGSPLNTRTMNLGPYSNNQFNQVLGDWAPVNGYVDVWADSDDALYYCYGSMLDNATSDPTTILPQASSADTSFIAAAAMAAGLEGAFFQTDVDLNNAGSTELSYELLWLPRGDDNSDSLRSEEYVLAPGAGVRYANVLDEVFGLEPDQVGGLAIEASGIDLLAMSRTYNLPSAKVAGTFGQELPGIPADQMIPSGVTKRILFLSSNDDVRSNVGCVNGAGIDVAVAIDLYDSDGVKLETKYMALPPYSNRQINGIFRDYAPINGYVDVRTYTSDALIYCYGSVLDNVTSDPTTVLPQ